MEDNRVVDAVEELRTKVRLQGRVDLLLHALVVRDVRGLAEADGRLSQVRGAEVRRHDQDRVLEVDRSSLGVGESPVFEDLQQRVEDVGVGLFDLVEEHDGEGLASNGFGELTTFVVTDVAGGRTDESAHGVLLHVLGHVELDQGVLVVEEELGQGLGQFGLTDAGRSEEDERSTRTLRVLQAGACASDGPADRDDGLVLADDALVEFVLHAQELGRLFFGEAIDRDAGPHREHFGDRVLVDEVEDDSARGLDRQVEFVTLGDEFALLFVEGLGLLEGATRHRALFVGAHAHDVLVELLLLRRRVHAADTQATAGLVDEVDGLVGQEPVRDVAVGEVRGRDQRLVGDLDGVELFVDLAQTLQDVDGHRDRRLFHFHRLETTLERGVLFDVLAVLVDRRGTDGLELPAREHRLQDRRGVDGAFGGTGTHEGVDLVDEQDDVAARADLLQHLLQTLFEVTAVSAAGDECAEVEGVELLVGQGDGHLVGDDLLGEALDDGGLAHAGLPDQDGVVLGAPRQHLHHALDFLLAPDERVEFALAGELREVATELIEDGRAAGTLGIALLATRGALGARLLAGLAGHHLDDLGADPSHVGAEVREDLCRDAVALAHQPEQHVLGPDVGVAELQGLAQRQLEHLLRPGGERRGPGRRRTGGAARRPCARPCRCRPPAARG